MSVMVNWIETIAQLLVGLAIIIPLVWKLVEYAQKAVKERNWKVLLNFVVDLMETAETQIDNGAGRKEWVLSMVQSSADSMNYDVDIEEVSKMIDNLCKMAKIVNHQMEAKEA